ncbi:hypothetical protein C8R47DRAFT_1067222 [Mycena vitilis]|nr:hypothetical protein C8R47DRAFT_1067222 [Mycena vitilis]
MSFVSFVLLLGECLLPLELKSHLEEAYAHLNHSFNVWSHSKNREEQWPTWAVGIAEQEGDVRWSLSHGAHLRHVTLIRMRAPENHVFLPWARLESYCELETGRLGGMVPGVHLARMSALRVLCLGGVDLPGDEEAPVTLPALQEFTYLVPPDVFLGLGTIFSGPRTRGKIGPGGTTCRKKKMQGEVELGMRFTARWEIFFDDAEGGWRDWILLGHLRACPSLRHLNVQVCHPELVNGDLVRHLADGSLVPELQTLALAERFSGDVPEEEVHEAAGFAAEIAGMVDGRFARGLRLLDFENRWREHRPRMSVQSMWEDAVEEIPMAPRSRDRGGWKMPREVRAEMLRLRREGYNVAIRDFTRRDGPLMEVID